MRSENLNKIVNIIFYLTGIAANSILSVDAGCVDIGTKFMTDYFICRAELEFLLQEEMQRV